VLLALRIESDGRLEKVHVERGSGYAVLDHSALDSLNRLGRLTEASAWLEGRSLDMQLPVIYRLIEN
jgi:TonB family protein